MKAYDTSILFHAKKIEEKKLKIQNLAKNGFCRDEIYVKFFTKCVISLEILYGFQQMKY